MQAKFVMLWPALLLLVSCGQPLLQHSKNAPSGPVLHLYLQPLPQEAQRLSLTIAEINARRSDGAEFPLLHNPVQLDPLQRMAHQTRLVSSQLPPGEYLGLSIRISEASVDGEDGTMSLLTDPEASLLSEKFFIDKDRVEALFFALNPERLVTAGYRLTATFSLWKPKAILPELKGVVSHPVDGTLTFFDKNTPGVVSVLKVGDSAFGMALDQFSRRLYLALSEENTIASIDLVRERVHRKTRLRAADRPTSLALSDDGRTLAVANTGSNSVSLIDTDSFLERERVIVPARPTDLFIGRDNRSVYVLQPEANALSVISLGRDEVVATIYLAESPFKGVAGLEGRYLYLLAEDSPNLLILDAQRLTTISQVFVGFGASCLTLDRGSRKVYVGRNTGGIVVVDPEAGLPVDWFQAGGPVVDIVHDYEQNRLFVQTATDRLLEKYDPVSHKRLSALDLPAAGYDVTVMGE